MKLVIANLKLNNPPAGIETLRGNKSVEVVVCPPDVYLESVKKKLDKSVKLGAQNVFWKGKGAYTGETSPAELKRFGVRYVIIGHSENRRWDKETDAMINKKIAAALKFGLRPVLCVGEPFSERKKGATAAKKFVRLQLAKDLRGIAKVGNLTVAYEPIWAIGTGRSAEPKDAAEMAWLIKDVLHSKFYISNSRVLYGGSVNSKNIGGFVQYKEMDGALVGGASLKLNEFKKIIKIISKNG